MTDAAASTSRPRSAARSTRRRWRRAPTLAVALAPMIDVVFLLLLYFLLSAEFRQSERFVPVELAAERGESAPGDPLALPRRPVVIAIRSTGSGENEYELSAPTSALGEVATFADLREALARSRGEIFADDQRFLVRAGDDARWEHTLRAIEAVRLAGFAQVTLAEPNP